MVMREPRTKPTPMSAATVPPNFHAPSGAPRAKRLDQRSPQRYSYRSASCPALRLADYSFLFGPLFGQGRASQVLRWLPARRSVLQRPGAGYGTSITSTAVAASATGVSAACTAVSARSGELWANSHPHAPPTVPRKKPLGPRPAPIDLICWTVFPVMGRHFSESFVTGETIQCVNREVSTLTSLPT